MTSERTKTRELLEQLASTEYRRKVRAEQIFRTLREDARKDDTGRPSETETEMVKQATSKR
ncbi:MAG: hypothetical protein AAF511_01435 [Pseudomonadota bacterium]